MDEEGSLHWDKINKLEKGKIYKQVKLLNDLSLRHGVFNNADFLELASNMRITMKNNFCYFPF